MTIKVSPELVHEAFERGERNLNIMLPPATIIKNEPKLSKTR
jgi:hypothetical protein